MTEKTKIIRCQRCNRRMRRTIEPGRGEWNEVWTLGNLSGWLCPDCQTAEDNAEAVINAATTDYSTANLYHWHEHTIEENAEVIIQAFQQHTEKVWRERLREVIASGNTIQLDINALTERAWTTLPEQWRGTARTPEAVDTGREIIHEHFRWLVDRALGRPESES